MKPGIVMIQGLERNGMQPAIRSLKGWRRRKYGKSWRKKTSLRREEQSSANGSSRSREKEYFASESRSFPSGFRIYKQVLLMLRQPFYTVIFKKMYTWMSLKVWIKILTHVCYKKTVYGLVQNARKF
jgi:hypothetical protein